MKKFKFRMQTVLEQRERVETIARQSFAEAEAAQQRATTLLEELQEVRGVILEELRAQPGTFDPAEMRLYQDYMQTITQSIHQQEEYVRSLGAEREARKMHMVDAAQNRQALDMLKERDQHSHAVRRQQAEQSQMDDLSTARFNFRQREDNNAA